MDKLKACPFCGSDDVRIVCYSGESMFGHCYKCEATTRIVRNRKVATKVWNNRAELEKYKVNLINKIIKKYEMYNKFALQYIEDGDINKHALYKWKMDGISEIIKLIESGELE